MFEEIAYCVLSAYGYLLQQLLETDRRNHDAYIRSGEIFEDRAQNYEKLVRGWEKLWSGVQR